MPAVLWPSFRAAPSPVLDNLLAYQQRSLYTLTYPRSRTTERQSLKARRQLQGGEAAAASTLRAPAALRSCCSVSALPTLARTRTLSRS